MNPVLLQRAKQASFLALSALLLSACGSSPIVVKDSGPRGPVDVSHIPDAVPRVEQRTKAGNKSPYTVLGKTYYVMPSAEGFRQEGDASWYGRKFHGRRTSNGEVYDMYGMTAAHKTLPIPSYVRVTNKRNGRSVVVRVNDRGPFHGGRIIDLTYTAASKLGFVNQGTAPVTVEVITPGQTLAATPAQSRFPSTPAQTVTASAQGAIPKAPAPKQSAGYQLPDNTFLQAGAFSSANAAAKVVDQIAQLTHYPVNIRQAPERDQLYRVRIGPISDNWELLQLRELLQKNRLPTPHVVYD
ncbi:septal ring lytic transglycosylase RlpA [Maricurvus nonylphenolicus]|uniref:septal ring lytic transglycosylase RlpA family protein n=1 Tax=Maricurvus nonylphenolicus TaxID=1008307 RepID=UPI0036F24CDB